MDGNNIYWMFEEDAVHWEVNFSWNLMHVGKAFMFETQSYILQIYLFCELFSITHLRSMAMVATNFVKREKLIKQLSTM